MILHQLHVKHSQRKEEPGMNNIIITGPPGVGKTELASVLSEVFVETGQIKANHVVFAKRSDLVGQYLGQTAIKTREVIEKAKGGILFIDEVYSLGHVDKRDFFAKECIDTLLQHMSEKPGDCMVMVAGYEEDVEVCFLSQNKGLHRRFTIRLNLPGYNGIELFDILKYHCAKDNWKLEDVEKVQDFIVKHAKDFQYFAGDMKTLLHRAKFISTQRLWKTSLDFQTECGVNFEDIRQAKEYMHKKIERDGNCQLSMYS
jgi:SpoVK/Ycf46/Vps4 family AAA+-type ATPase